MKTAVEWLLEHLEPNIMWTDKAKKIAEQAKEMEKKDTDNKVIHFAEWLTNKHTTTLITLYAQFEEEHYKENYESNI
jgi:hypothetical protein